MKRHGVILLLLIAAFAHGDTIILKNGNELDGKIEDVEADTIVLIVPGGKLSFEHDEILEIDLNDKGIEGEAASGPNEAATEVTVAPAAPSIADLPPPATDEERARRTDMLLTTVSAVSTNPEEATQEERDRIGDYTKALGQLGPAAAPQLEEIFRTGDIRMAGTMLEALQGADPARAEALAKDALKHAHPDARAAAIKILSESSDKEKAAALATALDDPRAPNRAAALQALAQTKDTASTDAGLKLLQDEEPNIRAEAITALQAITGQTLTTPEEWAAWAASR